MERFPRLQSEGKFSPEHIPGYLRRAAQEYVDVFASAGYQEAPPVGTASRNDPTVQFIGSTISALKPWFLQNKVPSEGLFIIQDCIRTQNEAFLYDDAVLPEYNTAFRIVGGISPMDKLENVMLDSITFFKRLGVEEERLLVRTSSADSELIEGAQRSMPQISCEVDSRQEKYYRWGYGIPGVTGRGLTYAIQQKSGGEHKDVGNIIIMEGAGHERAIQWGYGLETLLSRIRSLSQPIAASSVSAVIEYAPGLQAKYLDTFSACFAMFQADVLPGNTGRQKSLRNYLKGLSYLRRRLGISRVDLKSQIERYIQVEPSVAKYKERILLFIQQHEDKVQRCTQALQKLCNGKNRDEALKVLDNNALRAHLGNLYGVQLKEMYKIIEEIT